MKPNGLGGVLSSTASRLKNRLCRESANQFFFENIERGLSDLRVSFNTRPSAGSIKYAVSPLPATTPRAPDSRNGRLQVKFSIIVYFSDGQIRRLRCRRVKKFSVR